MGISLDQSTHPPSSQSVSPQRNNSNGVDSLHGHSTPTESFVVNGSSKKCSVGKSYSVGTSGTTWSIFGLRGNQGALHLLSPTKTAGPPRFGQYAPLPFVAAFLSINIRLENRTHSSLPIYIYGSICRIKQAHRPGIFLSVLIYLRKSVSLAH